MSRRKKIGLIVGLLGVGYVGVAAFRAGQQRNADIEAQVEPVTRQDLVSTIAAGGKIEAKRSVDISSAEISGRIVAIAVREGDMVQKGQLLLQIDAAQYETAVAGAEWGLVSSRANLVQARAQLDQAKRAQQRARQLATLGRHMIPPEEVEQAEMQFQVAEASYQSSEASLQQAEASLRDAREKLTKTRLVAPMAGRVINLAVEEGEVAVTGTYSPQSAVLMTIVDLSAMVAKVRVSETDAIQLTPNDSVEVTIDAFPDTTFVGRVARIRRGTAGSATTNASPSADFDVDIELGELPSEIQAGLSCTTRIVTGIRPRALSIPIIALTLRDHVSAADSARQTARTSKPKKRRDVEGVFVVQNGTVRFRAVEVGIVGDEHFEVVKGLREGETIVTGSYQAIRNLRDGSRIRIVDGLAADAIVEDAASGAVQ